MGRTPSLGADGEKVSASLGLNVDLQYLPARLSQVDNRYLSLPDPTVGIDSPLEL